MFLTDTHCHLNLDIFKNDLEETIKRALINDVKLILVPGLDIETSKNAINLAESNKNIYASIGFHPNNLSSWKGEKSIEALRRLAQHPKVVGFGEIGLDYYRDYSPKEKQKSVLQAQLDLAQELELPVILHNRDSHEDLLKLISTWYANLKKSNKLCLTPGVLHSFDGSLEFANNILEMNFFLGIGGPITFKNAVEKQNFLTRISLERLLLETDAPFLSPHPYRGKRNEPSNVPLIAKKIAEIKKIEQVEVARITTQNSIALFSWESVT